MGVNQEDCQRGTSCSLWLQRMPLSLFTWKVHPLATEDATITFFDFVFVQCDEMESSLFRFFHWVVPLLLCVWACLLLAGITSLLGSGVYTAAYPLHDVSGEMILQVVLFISEVMSHFSKNPPVFQQSLSFSREILMKKAQSQMTERWESSF